MCLSTSRSGGGGVAQGHPNQSSSARSTNGATGGKHHTARLSLDSSIPSSFTMHCDVRERLNRATKPTTATKAPGTPPAPDVFSSIVVLLGGRVLCFALKWYECGSCRLR